MSKIDHRELNTILAGCKQLQPQWQRALYDLLFDSILNMVSKFHVTQVEAEDLMQETFIRIFRNLNNYNAKQSEITTWACTIAKRLTINYCNSKHKRNLQFSIDGLENYQSVSNSISADLDWERVNLALAQIPKKYKEVFDRSVFQGMKHRAIADDLGITESSSRVYLSRAIDLIRKDFKSIA